MSERVGRESDYLTPETNSPQSIPSVANCSHSVTTLSPIEGGSSTRVHGEASWSRVRGELEGELDPQVFQAYIRPLRFINYQPNNRTLLIEAPSRFVQQHVDAHFGNSIEQKCRRSFGDGGMSVLYKLPTQPEGKIREESQPTERNLASGEQHEPASQTSLTTNNSSTNNPSTASASSSDYVVVKKIKNARKTPSPQQQTGIISRYTFDNFVVGAGNQFCHAAAMHVAEKPGHDYNPLFIYGGVGLGKTHLLHAIGNAVLSTFPEKKVLYLSSESFTNELIQSLRFAKMDEFKNRFRNIDLLLIDDIQFMCGKERTQEEFFHTFNALYSAKHQIVITSDKVPKDIPGIEERLQTRFAWGLTADIQAPDFETRVAILNRKASIDGFGLPEEIAHLIAESISSNVRELEGALTRLNALSSLQGVPLSRALVESALRPMMKKKVHTSISEIQRVVSDYFSIKVSEMVSKRRTKNLSFPRHVAMYLCRKHTTSSYPEIGQNFGGRDHSSVIHAANVVTGKVKDSKDLQRQIQEMEEQLFAS